MEQMETAALKTQKKSPCNVLDRLYITKELTTIFSLTYLPIEVNDFAFIDEN